MKYKVWCMKLRRRIIVKAFAVLLLLLLQIYSWLSPSYFQIPQAYAADMARLEWGVETGVTTSWTTVNLSNTFSSPIVSATALYSYTLGGTGDECSIEAEVQSVTSTSFQVRMGVPPHSSASSCTADPSSIEVHWLVAENTGTTTDTTLPGTSIQVQAGSFSTTNLDGAGDWTDTTGNVTIYPTFSAPITLSQRVSWNATNWATAASFRTGNRADYLRAGDGTVHVSFMDGGMSASSMTSSDTLHYIIHDGNENGTVSGDYGSYVQSLLSSDSILGLQNSASGYSMGTLSGFSSAPAIALADSIEEDGGDGHWWVTKSLSTTDWLGWAIEDQESDNERSHTTEVEGGIVFETSGAYPEATFTQNRYRWYVDNDSTNPVGAWGNPDLAENTAITITPSGNDPPNETQELRLRVNLTVNTGGMPVGMQQFTLQYKEGTDGSCTTGSWTDVGAAATWEYATSSVTDGADITGVLTGTDRDQEYAKSEPTQINHNLGRVNEDIEYDFHIIGTNISSATQYSFRLIEADDTVLDGYTNCPTLTTEPGPTDLMRHGRYYADEVKGGFFWAK